MPSACPATVERVPWRLVPVFRPLATTLLVAMLSVANPLRAQVPGSPDARVEEPTEAENDAGSDQGPTEVGDAPEETTIEEAPGPGSREGTEGLVGPRLLRSQHGHPAYPAGATGPARVLLEITIDAQGAVREATLVESDRTDADAERFSRAAREFVRRLRFEPAIRGGQAVPARVQFEVLFHPPDHTHDSHHPHPHHAHHHGAHRPHPHDARAQEGADRSPPNPTDAAPEDPVFGTIAEARRPYQATSSVDLGGDELRLRPFGSTGDLLNAASGFYVIQHAGGGKANQYFLRGFDADHGTDVALFVDGIPINHVSHGHGQGYAELHWVIPELVERMEIRKGPYFAEYGDFATAGAVNLVLRDRAEQSSFSLGGGTYDTFRGVAVLSPRVRGVDTLLAAEVYGTNGPFENAEHLRRLNLLARVGRRFAHGATLSLTLTGHLSGWNASGQIPLREVRAGRLDRFGTLDPNEGGSTQRHGIYASLRVPTGRGNEGGDDPAAPGGGLFELTSWLTYYRFALYSDFTFFSVHPLTGDMIRQGDERLTGGLRSSYEFEESLGPVRLTTRAGAQLRFDDIRNTLYDAPARELGALRVDAAIGQGSVGLFAEEDLRWRWVRAVVGLRADYFAFGVTDHLEDRGTSGTRTSGETQDLIVSPKMSLIVAPVRALELFANFGYGFHSNDARGVVRGTDPATPLSRARGYEVGARLSLFERLTLSAAAFLLDLDSETVWVGDEGTTEARGATRRLGVEAEARLKASDWLTFDLDATWTNATFVDNPANAAAVALAPTFMLQGGAVVQHQGTGLSGRLGVLYLADRPATEDGFLQAEGFYRLDASVRWESEHLALSLTVQNLTNAKWRQAQFATTSRLATETEPSACPAGTRAVEEDGSFVGCEDLHFTPGWPIHVMASASVLF